MATIADINLLVRNVLCLPIDSVKSEQFFVNESLFKTAYMLSGPHARSQVLLTHAWMVLFGVPPTPQDIRCMYAYLPINYGDTELPAGAATTIAKNAIHATFMRWKDADHSLTNKMVQELSDLNVDEVAARRDIILRWSFKVGAALDPASSMLTLARSIDSTKIIDNMNPFTGIYVGDVGVDDNDMSASESIRYAIGKDIFFQGSRMYGGTCMVVIDPGLPARDLADDARPMIEALAASQRPIVFWRSDVHTSLDVQEHLPTWDVHIVPSDAVLMSIPRGFAKCCMYVPSKTINTIKTIKTPQFESLSRRRETSYYVHDVHDVSSIQSFGTLISIGSLVETDFTSAISKRHFWIPRHVGRLDWVADLRVQAFTRQFEDAGAPINMFNEYVMRKLSSHVENNIKNNVKNIVENIVENVNKNNKTIVAIDNRRNPLTIFSILQSAACLDDDWDVTVLCTPDSADYYRNALLDRATIISDSPHLSKAMFNVEDYNALLKSDWVWSRLQSLGYKHALLVQDDGLLVRKASTSILDYMKYDYVGAPWADAPGNEPLKRDTLGKLTGNGGLSLRNIDAMMTVVKTRRSRLFHTEYSPEPEDAFFSAGVAENGLALCPWEESRAFSSEQILCEGSIGFHKPWPYHPANHIAKYLSSCLI